MVKIIKQIKKHCKNCHKHVLFTVEKQKKGVAKPNSWINRQSKRYHKTGKFNRVVKKSNKVAKRIQYRLTGVSCKHSQNFIRPRAKKIEFLK